MTRYLIGAGLLIWLGVSLLLATWSRTARPGLVERLAPFSPGQPRRGPSSVLSVESLRDLVTPAAAIVGDRVAGWFGVQESPAVRLRRVHATTDPGAFRSRQVGAAALALVPGLALSVLGLPLVLDLTVLAGAPLLTFLVVEQRLAAASAAWQESLRRELPVVSEQLAMLLNAGFSLGSAVNRLSHRGHGCAAKDLRVVVSRLGQGVSEAAALREWADVAKVDAVDRLVGVLVLNTASNDLGRLVSTEARQVRRDVQRRTSEILERRAQQVWIPVTVATLVPGTILLAVPFLAALRLFANA